MIWTLIAWVLAVLVLCSGLLSALMATLVGADLTTCLSLLVVLVVGGSMVKCLDVQR